MAKDSSRKLPQWLVLTPHQLQALRVLDAIGFGQLVHGENLNHVLLISKVLQLQDYKDFDVQLGVHLR